eukprot:gb/GFBE01074688.1/.p1 GENE.gb/GFBE01074688.1/~~gb/GFBE01074688.1/.p1  ORF type:complete len:337 (+),score=52.25 gb/GFBE01074688.1/:1-1011(+)
MSPRLQEEEDEEGGLSPMLANEELEDGWFRMGAPSGFVAHLREVELQALMHSGMVPPLAGLLRGASLRCLSRAIQAMTGAQSGWFKAATLFDCYCSKFAVAIEELPTTCLSIARITQKFDLSSETPLPYSAEYSLFEKAAGCAEDFGAWLSSAGYDVPEVTSDLVHKSEMEILRGLKWQIDMPCVERWLTAYLTRLSMIGDNGVQQVLQAVQTKSFVLARAVVMCEPVSEDLTNGQLALGLLCLGLVEVGLVPMSDLRPKELSLSAWTDMYLSSQPSGVVPACTRSAAESNRVFEMLLLCAETDYHDLKQTVRGVVEALGTVLASIHQHQAGQRRA